MHEDEDIWIVPLKDILSHVRPRSVWLEREITFDEIKMALKQRRYEKTAYQGGHDYGDETTERSYHAGRIAWLVVEKHNDPIEIDVGFPDLGQHPRNGLFDIVDGHHRLSAAEIRNDPFILVTYAGQCDRMPEIFPSGRIFR